MDPTEDRLEIVFFDVETTIPTRPRQCFAILEFGAILVCPRKLVELHHYSTLVRPADLSLISSLSERCNGISRDKVIGAPTFSEISDTVYGLLHGRIWAGHNIVKFDCVRVREAFAEVNKPPPEPKGMIDSLTLLTQKFGRRAGDMKMATLATYFGLGQQKHRSLDDVRMNLEVLKYCSTVLFLESSLPDILTANSWVSPNATTRSRSNGKLSSGISSSSVKPESNSMSFATQSSKSHHPIFSLITHGTEESKTEERDPFSMESLSNEITAESLQADVSGEDTTNALSPDPSSSSDLSDAHSSSAGYLEVGEVCMDLVSASLVLSDYGNQKIALYHKGTLLGLRFSCLNVRFGVSTKFVNQAGLPRLNFVVDATPSLCNTLDACDHIARKFYEESGGRSDWRNLVNRRAGYEKYPTARLHIPTAVFRDNTTYSTEMYRRESSGNLERQIFDKFDPSELDGLLVPGTLVDAFFWIDFYDYQQNAGMRLVADKLIIRCA